MRIAESIDPIGSMFRIFQVFIGFMIKLLHAFRAKRDDFTNFAIPILQVVVPTL